MAKKKAPALRIEIEGQNGDPAIIELHAVPEIAQLYQMIDQLYQLIGHEHLAHDPRQTPSAMALAHQLMVDMDKEIDRQRDLRADLHMALVDIAALAGNEWAKEYEPGIEDKTDKEVIALAANAYAKQIADLEHDLEHVENQLTKTDQSRIEFYTLVAGILAKNGNQWAQEWINDSAEDIPDHELIVMLEEGADVKLEIDENMYAALANVCAAAGDEQAGQYIENQTNKRQPLDLILAKVNDIAIQVANSNIEIGQH